MNDINARLKSTYGMLANLNSLLKPSTGTKSVTNL